MDEICKKFSITRKALNNKIHLKDWTVLGHLKDDIEGISASLGNLSLNGTKHQEVADIILTQLDTTLQDNELITNNRKISKLLHTVIIEHRDNIDLSNIKAISGTLKDIESIANPQSSKIDITNVNAQKNETNIDNISQAIASGLPD